MKGKTFSNFSDLYRAAFAERDPEAKLLLVAEVKKAIDDWEQTLHNWLATPTTPAAPEGSDRTNSLTSSQVA